MAKYVTCSSVSVIGSRAPAPPPSPPPSMPSSSGFHAPPASTTRPARNSCPAAVTVTPPAVSAIAVTSAPERTAAPRSRASARCAAVARRMSRMPDSGSCSATCSRPSRHGGQRSPTSTPLSWQYGRFAASIAPAVAARYAAPGAALLGDDQAAGSVDELKPGLPLGDVPALVGGRGQRGVLGPAVRVPDHPGMIFGCPAGVPVLVLLERQNAAAEPPAAASRRSPRRPPRTRPRSPGTAVPSAPSAPPALSDAHQAPVPTR